MGLLPPTQDQDIPEATLTAVGGPENSANPKEPDRLAASRAGHASAGLSLIIWPFLFVPSPDIYEAGSGLNPFLQQLMDHLVPSNCDPSDVVVVPYLGDIYPDLAYRARPDNTSNFLTLPEELGISTVGIITAEFGHRSKEEILCFIQSWCFFGVLHSMLQMSGLHFEIEDFIKAHPSGSETIPGETKPATRVVTTHLFPLLLLRMEERTRPGNVPDEFTRRVFRALADHLHTVFFFIHHCSQEGKIITQMNQDQPRSSDSSASEMSLVDRVILSVATLLEYLQCVTRIFWMPKNESFKQSARGRIEWIESLKTRLLTAGWCPSQVNLLADQRVELSTLYYLSHLKQRHEDGKSHENCADTFVCQYETLDETTYVTKHQPGCSQDCGTYVLESSQSEKLRNIVACEQTPVVRVEDLRDGRTEPTVTVVSAQEVGHPYICFSHVWQDGLGNPKANALPLCQMIRLQRWADSLDESSERPVPWWLDTLCVPIEPSYRKMAIENMHSIYYDAGAVLVLDSHILAQSVAEFPPLQLLLSISCSNWMRRLWTLQEAISARKLIFQFADEGLDLNQIFNKCGVWSRACETILLGNVEHERPIEVDVRLLRADVLLSTTSDFFASTCWMGGDKRDHLHRNPEELFRQLCWRNTSRLQDEPLCLASLLKVDRTVMRQIIQADEGTERMRLLMESLATINTKVLFTTRPRSQMDCWSWMPTSFLGGGANALLSAMTAPIQGPAGFSAITSNGLEVTRPGFVLKGDIVDENTLCARGTDINLMVTAAPDTFDLTALNAVPLAVLLEQPLSPEGPRPLELIVRDGIPMINGALVSVKSQRGSQILVQYRLKVIVWDTAIEFKDRGPENISFEMLPDRQKWLVQ